MFWIYNTCNWLFCHTIYKNNKEHLYDIPIVKDYVKDEKEVSKDAYLIVFAFALKIFHSSICFHTLISHIITKTPIILPLFNIHSSKFCCHITTCLHSTCMTSRIRTEIDTTCSVNANASPTSTASILAPANTNCQL